MSTVPDAPRPPFIEGQVCLLRPLERTDVDGPWLGWFNDPEVTRYMFRGMFPESRESLTEFYEHVAHSRDDLVLAIVDRESGAHVGNIGLHRIDWLNRSAEFGMVIGDRTQWGRGLGTEATRLVVRHGFTRLNLNRIWLGVFADHDVAIRLYEKVGFRTEGRLRAEVIRDGRAHDKLIMGLLASESGE